RRLFYSFTDHLDLTKHHPRQSSSFGGSLEMLADDQPRHRLRYTNIWKNGIAIDADRLQGSRLEHVELRIRSGVELAPAIEQEVIRLITFEHQGVNIAVRFQHIPQYINRLGAINTAGFTTRGEIGNFFLLGVSPTKPLY